MRGFGGKLKCAAFVKPEEIVSKGGFLTRLTNALGLSKPRAPLSGADPSNLVGERIDTEGEVLDAMQGPRLARRPHASPSTRPPPRSHADDVLHIKQLPTFGNRISQRNTELLLQYLTVPYLRIPLVLQFFARHEHISALACEELQEVRRLLCHPNSLRSPWTCLMLLCHLLHCTTPQPRRCWTRACSSPGSGRPS